MNTRNPLPAIAPFGLQLSIWARRSPKRLLFAMAVASAVALGFYAPRPFRADRAAKHSSSSESAIQVTVQTLRLEQSRAWTEFSGRVRAIDSAEIRPEVGGRITEVRFVDGQDVKVGAILFVIEPQPFEAAADRAKARVASAKAALQFATLEQVRNSSLVQSRSVAQREADQADTAKAAAAAELLGAEAELRTAEIDLDHAYLKAPISGRVGRAELTVGNLVQGGPSSPLLTTIVSEQGMYVDFEVDEQTYLQTIRGTAEGNDQEGKIPVELTAPGKSEVIAGHIQSFDNRLDPTSGTIRARARFKNLDGKLVPGMFMGVRLSSGEAANRLRVDEKALGFDQARTFVLVVSPEERVEYREVELGESSDGLRSVLGGLKPGERVIVEGLQRVRPGALVAPTEQVLPESGSRTAQEG